LALIVSLQSLNTMKRRTTKQAHSMILEAFPERSDKRIVVEDSFQVEDTSSESFSSSSTDRSPFADCRAKRKIPPRAVSFGKVQVREYERVICYNPACSAGAAIGIGWNYVSQQTIKLDEHEKTRPPRRDKQDFRLGEVEREKLLSSLGYDVFDILASTREIGRVQRNRLKSLRSIDHDGERGWKHMLAPMRSLFARKGGSEALRVR
jgi:hypothetical protein